MNYVPCTSSVMWPYNRRRQFSISSRYEVIRNDLAFLHSEQLRVVRVLKTHYHLFRQHKRFVFPISKHLCSNNGSTVSVTPSQQSTQCLINPYSTLRTLTETWETNLGSLRIVCSDPMEFIPKCTTLGTNQRLCYSIENSGHGICMENLDCSHIFCTPLPRLSISPPHTMDVCFELDIPLAVSCQKESRPFSLWSLYILGVFSG